MSLAKPIILGNAALLDRDGTEGFQLGVAIALTLQTTLGYASFAWSLSRAPEGSVAELATPATFASSFTPDVAGQYWLRGTAAGDASNPGTLSSTVVVLVVRTANRGIRKIDPTEYFENDADLIRDAFNESAEAVDANRIGRAAVSMTSDANRTVTAAERRARFLDVSSTGTLTATRELVIDPTGQTDPWWFVRNNTTGSQSLTVKPPSGTGVTLASGTTKAVFFDGTNMVG